MIIKNIRQNLSVIVASSLILISLTSCLFSNEKSEKLTADDWVDKAAKQYDNGDYASAAKSFGYAIKLDSSTSLAYPGLMKSIIKRDSLIEKYFDVEIAKELVEPPAFAYESIKVKNEVYQTLIYLDYVRTIYINKAQANEFGEDFKSISGIVNDVTFMYLIAKCYDLNYDSIIDENDIKPVE